MKSVYPWLVLLVLCAPAAHPRAAGNPSGCLQSFNPAVDYFPDKTALEDARTFSVEYHKSYKVLTVNEAYDDGPLERYVLLQCGAPAPRLVGPLASAQIVPIPIRTMFAASTTHLPLLIDLNRIEILTGIARGALITPPAALAHMQRTRVVDFAANGVIDVELVVARKPSIVLANSSNAAYAALRAAGVPVVANAEWLEPTALARAEWIKHLAVLLNEEKRAQDVYAAMKRRYLALVKRTAAIPASRRPLVMTGRATRGVYFAAGGRSYVADLINAAGGRYVWPENMDTGTATTDLEAQLARAANADVWINGGGWASLAAMLADDPRYVQFKAFRQGQVWLYNRVVNEAGGNDYWARGITHPDLILADLIKILHPHLVPDHEFQWYKRVPAK